MSPAEFGLSHFERIAYRGISLALISNGFTMAVDSLALKEYSKACEIEFLWLFDVAKRVANELNAKD